MPSTARYSALPKHKKPIKGLWAQGQRVSIKSQGTVAVRRRGAFGNLLFCEELFPLQDHSSNDEYLFDLDHFVSMAAEPSSDVDPKKLPPLPKAAPGQPDSDVHLVLDARLQGSFCLTSASTQLLLLIYALASCLVTTHCLLPLAIGAQEPTKHGHSLVTFISSKLPLKTVIPHICMKQIWFATAGALL